MNETLQELENKIRVVPDYPKPGISFKDITPILNDGPSFKSLIDQMAKAIESSNIQVDKIIGIESRGFILGAALAHHIGVGFAPIRKKGKLPYETLSQTYELEYGEDHVEIHCDAVEKGEKILIVDDLMATGGTAWAAIRLCEKLEAKVEGIQVFIELSALKGRDRCDVPVHSLLKLN